MFFSFSSSAFDFKPALNIEKYAWKWDRTLRFVYLLSKYIGIASKVSEMRIQVRGESTKIKKNPVTFECKRLINKGSSLLRI